MRSQSGALRIGLLERSHPPNYQGAVVDRLIPLLREGGARVELVAAEERLHHLNRRPAWDIVVLKSGSPAALHVAASAESWGIPCVNGSMATRLAQDKLASATILQRAGLPIADAHLAWLPLRGADVRGQETFARLSERSLIIKAARGSRGAGLWWVEPGMLSSVVAQMPEGPYLLMEYLAHSGDDLKVFVAGSWLGAIERPFPATTYEEKRGRPVEIPAAVAEVVREAGGLLGLTCFGCDFVQSAEGWRLVDVNAFPGYKGPPDAPAALAAEILRVARGTVA